MLLKEFGPDAIDLIPEFLGIYLHFADQTEETQAQKLRQVRDYYREVLAELHELENPQY